MINSLGHSVQPSLIIRPSSGWRPIDLRELWKFRGLFLTLGLRDITLRYRQTMLGVIWVVLQPLLSAAIFAFVFGKVAGLSSDGVPYFLFAYAGLLGWTAFSSTVTKASASLVNNAPLVTKVYFPRLILPLSTLCSTLVDFGIGLVLMVVMLVSFGVALPSGLLLLPAWLLLLLLLATGLSLVAAALIVRYRDVGHILPVLIQMLLYASPIAYPVSAVPERLRAFYFLNPLSGLMEAFRWSLLGRGDVRGSYLVYSAVVSVAVFVLGSLYFRRAERRFDDII